MNNNKTAVDVAPSPFQEAFHGAFTSALRWPQLDDLWSRVRSRAGEGWYIYAVGEPLPEGPADAAAVERFIAEIDALLRREHQEDYCGIVYADDLRNPSFIKIYDPNNLGVSCGYSDNPPPPGWLLTLMPPEVVGDGRPNPKGRSRWWQRLLGR